MKDERAFELEPVSGKNNVWFEGSQAEVLNGGKDDKQKLEGFVGRKTVKLVERDDIQENGQKYSENWKKCKDAGLPVVPTLRKTKDGKVLMTDLTADGSRLYGKSVSIELNWYGRLSYGEPMFDFLTIIPYDEFEKIISKTVEYTEIASKKGILLPDDDPFELVVHPDGKWNLVILDLERLYITTADTELFDANMVAASRFIGDLKEIRDNLLKRQIQKRVDKDSQ